MSLVTVKSKFQVVIPRSVREQIGISLGDTLEAKVERGKITFTPKAVVVFDGSEVPTAGHEYTAAQRRAIDARLRKAEKGPFFGPFKSGEEIAAFLKSANVSKPSRKPSRAR
jgi:AbrB family looped-hinge helix DNA binding protein